MNDHTVAKVEVTSHHVTVVCACGLSFASRWERSARERQAGHARVAEIRRELEER